MRFIRIASHNRVTQYSSRIAQSTHIYKLERFAAGGIEFSAALGFRGFVILISILIELFSQNLRRNKSQWQEHDFMIIINKLYPMTR